MAQSPSGLTPADALAAARAAAEARNPGDLSVAVAVRTSEGIIAARERAAAWGKRLLRSIWTPVDPYDGDQVAEFAATAARHLATAQKATATAAAAGQIQLLSSMGVRVSVRPTSPDDIRGTRVTFDDGQVELEHRGTRVRYRDQDPVDLDAIDFTNVEVLNRPARTVRYLESKGATREQAEAEALKRLDALVDGNMMLAQRLAESEVINAAANLSGSTVVGMRRIIHPELSRTGTCGLCIAASDRLYIVRELLPMHANCKCTSAPVTEEFDPADELNKADLRQLYRDAGGTSRAHLKRTRYKVDEHGELGPTLIPGRKYKPRSATSKKQAGATAVSDPETKAEIAARHLPILENNLAQLRAGGLTEESPQVKYHIQQIQRLRGDLNDEAGQKPAMPPTTPPPPSTGGGTGGPTDGDDENDHPDLTPEERAEARQAAEKAVHAATGAEPAISAAVRGHVEANGGELHRFETRLKSVDSLYRKIQDEMAQFGDDGEVAAAKIRDKVRYTAVLPEDGYWARGTEIADRLVAAGFTRSKQTRGWRREGYRGRNDTFKTADGVEFEVQFHTPASLYAAEVTHPWYEEARLPTTSDQRRAELDEQQNTVFAAVPAPDDVPWVD